MIKVSFKRQPLYVLIKDGKLHSVYLPGDLFEITSKLTASDIKTIEKRAFKKMVRG